MMARGAAKHVRAQAIDRACPALMFVSLACAVVVEALHGHACTGDGCMLCLVVAIANVLLVTCVGLALAQPVLRVFVIARPIRTLMRLVRDASPVLCAKSNPHVCLTPVSMGVKLLI